MKIDNVKIKDVKPYERNARKNDKAVDEVVKSIQRTGYRTPIIVDENMVILCGHTRLKALKKMGWNEIPFVIKYDDLTEELKQEYRIRDNKTGEIAEWDFEILEEDFEPEELVAMGFPDESEGLSDAFNLPEGEKGPLQQITFTLANEQAEYIKNIISDIKQTEEYKYVETYGNENGNGNALYLLVTKCQL